MVMHRVRQILAMRETEYKDEKSVLKSFFRGLIVRGILETTVVGQFWAYKPRSCCHN